MRSIVWKNDFCAPKDHCTTSLAGTALAPGVGVLDDARGLRHYLFMRHAAASCKIRIRLYACLDTLFRIVKTIFPYFGPQPLYADVGQRREVRQANALRVGQRGKCLGHFFMLSVHDRHTPALAGPVIILPALARSTLIPYAFEPS